MRSVSEVLRRRPPDGFGLKLRRPAADRTAEAVWVDARRLPNPRNAPLSGVGLLDSPEWVILEHEPVKFIRYDGIVMRDSLVARITEGVNAAADESA